MGFSFSYAKQSLRGKILTLGLGTLLVSTVLLGLFAMDRGEKAILDVYKANLERGAAQITSRISEVLEDVSSDLSIWSKLDIAPLTLDKDAPKFFSEFANQAIQNKNVYSYMVLAKPTGEFFAMNSQDVKGVEVATHPLRPAGMGSKDWFGKATGVNHTVYSEPFVPKEIESAAPGVKVNGRALAAAHVVLDMMDDPVGVWISFLDWKWFENYLETVTRSSDGVVSSFALLIGPDMKIIASPPSANVAEAAFADIIASREESLSGVVTVKTPSGNYLVRSSPVPANNLKDAPKWTVILAEHQESALKTVFRFKIILLIACFVVSIAGAAAIRHFSHKAISEVTEPLYKLGEGIQRLQQGDLTATIEPAKDKSLAALAVSYNETVAVLNQAIQEVDKTSHAVRSSATRVSEAVRNFAERDGSTRSVLESVTEASTAMAVKIEMLNEMCKALEHSSDEASQAAGHGSSQVDMTRRAMEETVNSVRDINNAMNDLRNRLDQIDGITTAIDKIASETQMLALNATIEAARAGEAGRGFAVVADEMKRLTLQTSDMARLIRKTTMEIKKGSQEVDHKVRASEETSDNGLDTAARTEEALNKIKDAVYRTRTGIAEITGILETQSEMAARIPQSLDTVNKLSDHTRSDLEHVSQTTEQMLLKSDSMEEILKRFKS